MNSGHEVMNKILANLIVLYMKLHHCHWFVKGPHFFSLHKQFEELYDETADMMDEVAERMLAIKGTPVSTLEESLRLATIKETKQRDVQEMVREICADLEGLNKQIYEAISELEGDEGTIDVFVGIIKAFDKHVWMLRSYLE